MKEFFGIGGYRRPAQGFLSWQHLLFVGLLLIAMTMIAYHLGNRNKNKSPKEKNRPLVWAALWIDGLEILKIAVLCYRGGSWKAILYNLPLFLCSIQLITIPLAAFAKGRLKEASIDFVCVFGIVGAVLGTLGAGQNYNAYPVLSMDNVVSGITHCISGFASLYIMYAGLAGMKKSNMGITFSILLGVSAAAYIVNVTIDYNYMFLMRGDGTPYDFFYDLVNGNRVLYPLVVIGLFLVYMEVFYRVFYRVCRKRQAAKKTPMIV